MAKRITTINRMFEATDALSARSGLKTWTSVFMIKN